MLAAAEQHVGGLDVTVHESDRVRIGEAGRDLGDDVERRRQRRSAVLLHQPAEVARVDQLGGDVEATVGLAVREHGHHVRRPHRGLRPCLVHEPGPEAGVIGEV